MAIEEIECAEIFGNELPELLLVGEVEIVDPDQTVSITAVGREACPRCWRPDPLSDADVCTRCHVAVES